jgi:hypothetical protein
MITFSRTTWNILLIAVLALGSLLIAATRVRPDAAAITAAPGAAVTNAPAPLPTAASRTLEPD